ncbi:MAG: Calx-beta domain-containing protein [Pseudomonadota bacterium]
MTWFKRWLRSLILALSVGVFTLGCQVLFGDFKVGDQAHGGAGGENVIGTSGGSTAHGGGAGGNAQPSGPILVVPTSDLFTSDLGAQAKFYVSLAQKPTAPVTIPIASTNAAEGTVSPASLSFSTDDWNAPQVVTVTGVHDPQVGNQPYSVDVGPAISDDKSFQGAKITVAITNIDNDSAGFFVTPTKGLVTTEAGGQAFFTVVLNSRPAADVVISLTSSDDSIGTVAPGSLTFTTDNWSAPQTVAVTGVNDDSAGGDRSYQITVGPPMSSDQSFAKLLPETVDVINQDNDQAGVMVGLATGIDPSDPTRLRTSENGDSATFTVVLNKAPSKDVTLAVASSSSEGTVNPISLTFTHLNWNAPQTVTVVGVDNDSVADGNQPYQVTLGPLTTDDAAYGALSSADLPYVNVINVDNDDAGYAVTLLTGVDPNDASELLTSEQGGAATFSLVLTSKPKNPVQFGLTSINAGEGQVSPAQLDFAVDNWNVAQIVTVTGVDDNTKDGNVVYAVRIGAPTTDDPAYQKLASTDVKVVNQDNDVAGITSPKLLTGIDGGTKLVTTEANAGSASFSISLTSKPTGDVKVPVTSSDTTEGAVMPATLTFTPANYATAQVVTVTGQDDSVVDGNQAYTVTVGPSMSSDTNYVGLSQSVKVTNKDDDSAYIVPTPGYMGTTTEKGGTAVFGIHLNSQPTASVTVSFVSSDLKEGKVSPATLLFTTANWGTSQNITVTGVNDDIADGDQSYNIAVSGGNTTDQNYMYAATTLTIVNKDDDVVGFKVTAAANLQTTEGGGKATFTLLLTSQPTGNVNVGVTSSNTKEGTAAPASLSFTASNWSVAQTVTVTGVDDSVADGDQTYTVSLKTASSSADPKYVQLAASTVSLVNKNDDDPGITVTPSSPCATTPTTTATFKVVLTSQPLGPVSIALSSDTPTEGTVAPATLSFTAATWNVPQPFTVTGVDDGTMGMMTPYKIITGATVSAMDPKYNGINVTDMACVNTTPLAPPPSP